MSNDAMNESSNQQVTLPTRPPGRGALTPMGEGKWAGIVRAANGAPRYGHIACMGCGSETGGASCSSYIGADGNWYCGTPLIQPSPCEAYTTDTRKRLGIEGVVIR